MLGGILKRVFGAKSSMQPNTLVNAFTGERINTHVLCPDCSHPVKDFICGPEGGMSQDVLCPQCHHEYCVMWLSRDSFSLIDDLGKGTDRVRTIYGITEDNTDSK